ncbi:Prefoldin [Mycena capillaripes]|nr:Prefoldin [Mycena capillaripes]
MSQPQSELADVRRQLEGELNHLTNSFGQPKQAQAKFKACIENVTEIKPAKKDGKTILVPLTNSLYVPGKLSDPDQTRQQAVKHYSTKVEYIQGNLVTLEETIRTKRENMNYLFNVMQSKVQQLQTVPCYPKAN